MGDNWWNFQDENIVQQRREIRDKLKRQPKPPAPLSVPAPKPPDPTRIQEIVNKYKPPAMEAPAPAQPQGDRVAELVAKYKPEAPKRGGLLGGVVSQVGEYLGERHERVMEGAEAGKPVLKKAWDIIDWTGQNMSDPFMGAVRAHLMGEGGQVKAESLAPSDLLDAWQRAKEYQHTRPMSVNVMPEAKGPLTDVPALQPIKSLYDWQRDVANKVASGGWSFVSRAATDPLNLALMPAVYKHLLKAGGMGLQATRGLYAPKVIQTGKAAGTLGEVAGLAGRALNVGDIAFSAPFGALGDVVGMGLRGAKAGLRQAGDFSALRPIGEAIEGAPAAKEVMPTGKQPWEMTQAEWHRDQAEGALASLLPEDVGAKAYWESVARGEGGNVFSGGHEQEVAKALSEGKPVPPAVLADYPDLAAKAAGVAPADSMVDVIALGSPSGRMSAAALKRAQARNTKAIFGEGGLKRPQGPVVDPVVSLRRQAEELNRLADGGMHPISYKKKALELEAQAAALEAKAAPVQAAPEPKAAGQTDLFGNAAEYPGAARPAPMETQPELFPGAIDKDEMLATSGVKRREAAQAPAIETPIAAVAKATPAENLAEGAQFVDKFPMSRLRLDPDRFQFKWTEMADTATGQTKELKGQPYNRKITNPIGVWKDGNGDVWVVNGHQRYGMAKDSGVSHVPIAYMDVSTDTAARALGALQNIAEGRGTPMDAAKWMRDTGLTAADLVKEGVSLKGSVAKTGLALSKLNDTLFNRVVQGTLPESRGAIIGDLIADADVQIQLVKRLDELDARGRVVNDKVFTELVESFSAAPRVEVTQNTLFGAESFTQSLALERAELAAAITERLGATKRVMGTAVKHKGMLEEVGSQIAEKASSAAKTGAEQTIDVFTRTKNLSGPVSEMLDDGARRIANGEPVQAVAREVSQNISDNLSDIVAGRKVRGATRVQEVGPHTRQVEQAAPPAPEAAAVAPAPIAAEVPTAAAASTAAQPPIAGAAQTASAPPQPVRPAQPGLQYGGVAGPAPVSASQGAMPGMPPAAAAPQPAQAAPPPPPRTPPPARAAAAAAPPPAGDELAKLRVGLTQEAKPPLRDRLAQTQRKAIEQLLDRNTLADGLQRETGVAVHDAMQIVPGARVAGEAELHEFVHPVLKRVGKDFDHLQEYMTAMRMKDALDWQPDMKLAGAVVAPDRALAQLRAEIGPQRWAQVETAARELWDLNDQLVLQPRLAEGLLSQEAYDAIRQRWPHYIPFMRQGFDDFDVLAKGLRSEADISSTIIKRMQEEGSERALKNPMEMYQAQVIKTQMEISRNQAAKALRDALEQAGTQRGETLIQILRQGDDVPSGLAVMHWFEDGQMVRAAVPTEYAAMAKGLNAESANALSRLVLAMSKPLRVGAVSANPAFLLANKTRDAMSAWYREGLVPLSKYDIQGWVAAITKNADWYDTAKSGALLSGLSETIMRGADIKAPKHLGALSIKSPMDAFLLLPRLVMKANEIGEQATRIAVFKKLKAAGLTDLEAAVRSRNATVDFSKSGNLTRMLNQAIPFLNAGIQGSANTVSMMRKKPGTALLRAAPLGMASIMFYLWNQRYETSGQIPDYEYANNWVIQIGEGTENPDPRYPTKAPEKFPIYVKIPKGPMGAFLTAPVEMLIKVAWGNDDRSVVEHIMGGLETAGRAMLPIEPTASAVVPPLLGTALQLQANRDFFRGRDIVPQSEMSRPETERYGVETSDMARLLGEKFGVSPRVIDFAIQDYTAGAGQAMTWLADLGLNALGYNPETNELRQAKTAVQELSTTPVVSRFIGTKGNQPERVDYERLDKAAEAMRKTLYQNSEVKRLGMGFNPPGDTVTVNGTPMEIPPAKRAEIVNATTPLVKQAFDLMVQTSTYKAASDIDKKKKLDTVRQKITDNVRATLLADITGEQPKQPMYTTQDIQALVMGQSQALTGTALSMLKPDEVAQIEAAEKEFAQLKLAYPQIRQDALMDVYKKINPRGWALVKVGAKLRGIQDKVDQEQAIRQLLSQQPASSANMVARQ